jgi:two-component system nitrogen regulation sensor histidine kinase NtrY
MASEGPPTSPPLPTDAAAGRTRSLRPLGGGGYERRLLLLALAAVAPGTIAALLLLWFQPWPVIGKVASAILLTLFAGQLVRRLRDRAVRPLQTIANLLSALREGDFSLRASPPEGSDALGQVHFELNALGETLREQRLGAVEATALLHRVVEEVDVAVFAFDDAQKLRLVNRAGERLLGASAEEVAGRSAESLDLADCLEGGSERTIARAFPGGKGRWGVRHSVFRERGLPHRLLVISDLSQTLREEERQAWRRLIRVLGHELNNSLAPIRALAGTLAGLFERQPRPDDFEEDMRRGLAIIGDRAEALTRFMAAYARLARLPPPKRAPLEVAPLMKRAAALETRLPVFVERGPAVRLDGDIDQLEQLLINLLRNAADAALPRRGGVGLGWQVEDDHLVVRV